MRKTVRLFIRKYPLLLLMIQLKWQSRSYFHLSGSNCYLYWIYRPNNQYSSHIHRKHRYWTIKGKIFQWELLALLRCVCFKVQGLWKYVSDGICHAHSVHFIYGKYSNSVSCGSASYEYYRFLFVKI